MNHSTDPCKFHSFCVQGGGAAGVLAGAVTILDGAVVLMTWPIATPTQGLCGVIDADLVTNLQTTLAHATDNIIVTWRNR